MNVGAAVVDVTPPAGLPMAGFAARTSPATRTHDPLTVRAVCVDDTALVTVDAVGLHEDTCAEVRRRCPLPDDRVVVHATHTHGGPASMPGRLGHDPEPGWLAGVVDACVEAVATALRRQRPVELTAGYGTDPGVARNRRRPGGPVDGLVPVAWFTADGDVVAVVVSYACHPVVLGADNTHWTADYPGVVRAALEARHPGAVALFVTGCAGDANHGHSAHASVTTAAAPTRTYAEAARIGRLVADAADTAPCRPAHGGVRAAGGEVTLDLDVPTGATRRRAADQWSARLADADQATAVLLRHWLDWAASDVFTHADWTGRVSVLHWGTVRVVALPGEPFAAAAPAVRAALADGEVGVVAGYCDGCPGYLPTCEEYTHGGYEVAEAHRFYGLPGAFAAGSLERLVASATTLIGGS